MLQHGILIKPGKGFAGKEEDFFGSKAASEEIIQEEVVQLIRAHEVLGLLFDVAHLVRRNKFRADRRVGYVQKDFGRTRGILETVFRRPYHQSAHKGFRYAHVDSVHRHVVTIVGAPAKC